MRTLLFVCVSLIVLVGAASATPLTLNCALFPVTFSNGAGTTSVACPAFSVGGASALNSVSLNESDDYQFGSTNMNTVQVSFTPAVFSSVTWNPPTAIATVSGTLSSGAAGAATQVAATGVSLANFASAFTVTLTSAVTQGTVTTSSGGVQVTYDYTQASTVPEPATISMLGLGILALGFVAHAFRK